jgi:hypothetical protein
MRLGFVVRASWRRLLRGWYGAHNLPPRDQQEPQEGLIALGSVTGYNGARNGTVFLSSAA